jgi:hypothetical protein
VLTGAPACWYIAWSLLVLPGWAQGFIDFLFWLHFIAPPYQVRDFALGRALALVIVTAALGYVLGGLVGVIRNRVNAWQRGA